MEFYDIRTRRDLVDFLHISQKRFTYLLYRKGIDNLYTSFDLHKKSGGIRKIHVPNDELKSIQKALETILYTHKSGLLGGENNISHGFERKKSIITNAKIHRNKRLVLNIDLEDFFESFHFGRVRGYFKNNKNFLFSMEVATIIAQLTCYKGTLPQGAPSSPIITNLICKILDHRLLKISKKYKLDYTRYADDLTFSTNNKKFLEQQTEFYERIKGEIIRAGFKINDNKTRLQIKDTRQMVTGLVVNKKINVNRIFYKKTRAMAFQLYKEGNFQIEGKPGSLNQLEGRFAFINQLCRYNNKIDGEKHSFHNLNSRETQYQKFLFYKYFYANPKPLIVTEGKTDIAYLKSALKNLHLDYPNLITKKGGNFEFKVSFLKRTKRLRYFLNIDKDGADSLKNIYNYYDDKKQGPNYFSYFREISKDVPKNPVIFMFDNEIESGAKKPIGNFLKHSSIKAEKIEFLKTEYKIGLTSNLYLLTVPSIPGLPESDIEDLFNETTLSTLIGGKSFIKKDKYDTSKYYGKEIFSQYIIKNYQFIDFNKFRPLLDKLNDTLEEYTKKRSKTLGVIKVSEKVKEPLNV
ncbi:retron Ec67 family RNA-directed DNA polymerase/endonuclease [Alkalihalobacillus pseudalcaliphilus]|uniref:retron Ec67 family RNA-directed DNA polymerase/endonuclease n=1 Tax=Alkalihalobacillus pseudalcaliphilus TaxID=79884 RepID=UPI00235DC617|nr:retron Ec67 family RNA-directed DNA polymerase/endonuclease [Alkalihalobacillus pseudalcaliphilus]